ASVAKNGPLRTPDNSTRRVRARVSHTANAAATTTPAPISGGPHGGSTASSGAGLYSPATSRPSARASSAPPATSTPAVSRAGRAAGTTRHTTTAATAD